MTYYRKIMQRQQYFAYKYTKSLLVRGQFFKANKPCKSIPINPAKFSYPTKGRFVLQQLGNEYILVCKLILFRSVFLTLSAVQDNTFCFLSCKCLFCAPAVFTSSQQEVEYSKTKVVMWKCDATVPRLRYAKNSTYFSRKRSVPFS